MVAALADQRRDAPRVVAAVAGGASSTLNATSGGRAATSAAPAVGCGARGPKSGRSSPARDAAACSVGRPAAAQLRARAAAREHAVEEDRQPELVAEHVGDDERLGARGAAPVGVEVHDGHDVDRPDVRVQAAVGA